MALTLASAEDQVRAFTRHTGDTTRLTQPNLRIYLNTVYRQLRSWLRDKAPRYYLLTSTDQVVAAGGTVTLTTVSSTIEAPHRVDWKLSDGTYRPMEAADQLDPNTNQTGLYTWREEGGVLKFGPDALFAGTVRVLYHNTVADISSGSFEVPTQLDLPLVWMACGLVALADGDGSSAKDSWDKLAEDQLKKSLPQLLKAHGVHTQNSGLRVVMGY